MSQSDAPDASSLVPNTNFVESPNLSPEDETVQVPATSEVASTGNGHVEEDHSEDEADAAKGEMAADVPPNPLEDHVIITSGNTTWIVHKDKTRSCKRIYEELFPAEGEYAASRIELPGGWLNPIYVDATIRFWIEHDYSPHETTLKYSLERSLDAKYLEELRITTPAGFNLFMMEFARALRDDELKRKAVGKLEGLLMKRGGPSSRSWYEVAKYLYLEEDWRRDAFGNVLRPMVVAAAMKHGNDWSDSADEYWHKSVLELGEFH